MTALLLLLLPISLFAQSTPMQRELARLERKGYGVAERATGSGLRAYMLSKGGRNSLYVYRANRRGAKLLHMEPGYGKRVRFADIHREGRLPDLLGDGSHILAYTVIPPGHMTEKTTVMRWGKAGLSRIAQLPFASFSDVDGDGKVEVVSSERPLGAHFDLSCDDYLKLTHTAYRTRVFGFVGAGLRDISAQHRDYFENLIAQREEELAPQDPRSTDDFGGYLGTAVSLYYDYHAAGRAREGWRRLHALFPVKWSDPGSVKKCFKSIKEELRDKLEIPANW
jgi:hypothetical protein